MGERQWLPLNISFYLQSRIDQFPYKAWIQIRDHTFDSKVSDSYQSFLTVPKSCQTLLLHWTQRPTIILSNTFVAVALFYWCDGRGIHASMIWGRSSPHFSRGAPGLALPVIHAIAWCPANCKFLWARFKPCELITEFTSIEPYIIQTNIRHQQSEEGTRPLED